MLIHNSILYTILLLGVAKGALNPIEIKGAKFFDSVTGEQFFMRGMAYQPRKPAYYDVLGNADFCQRDVKYMKDANVNMIRVYETYPDENHDACMKIFDDAGIYVGIDLSTSRIAINRDHPTYTLDLLEYFIKKIDVFSKYSNTLMFFAGNEVANEVKTTPSAAFIKASLRDAKAHIKTLPRYIPIGYADNDDHKIREQVQDYFNCGKDNERADFYGINIYSWCGQSTFHNSGYDKLTKILSTYSTPVFFSEAGCKTVRPRSFGDFTSLYTSDMDQVFSGGIAYEFSEEPNNYGLVDIVGNVVTPRDDYYVVQKLFKAANPTGIMKDKYTPTNKHRECPPVTEDWLAHSNLPPPASKKACDCAVKALTCKLNKEGEDTDNGKTVGSEVGTICGNDLCSSISYDAETGKHGEFSTCSTTDKASIAFNEAVIAGAKCEFGTFSEKQSPSGSLNKCKKIVEAIKAGLDTPDDDSSNANALLDVSTLTIVMSLASFLILS